MPCRGRWTISVLLAGVLFPGLREVLAQSCVPARTALVLSGGGAKGFAHIGVLQVLDSMGLKPDLVVGTSIGAIVGALYASGYSANQIDSLMHLQPFESVIRRYEPKVSASLGLLKPLAVWERGLTGYGLQSGAVREGEVNALLSSLMLRGNLLARGNFDSMPIPFRAVATDLVGQRPVVLSGGDLARAVRASAALPVVFHAVRLDSVWLTDGGLSDNTSVAGARRLGAARVWVSRLPYAPPDPNSFDDPLTLSSALVNSLFKEDSASLQFADVNIVNPTSGFDNLDFRRSTGDSLIKLGHEAARAAFAEARCLKPLGTARVTSMPTRVGSVVVAGHAVDGPAVVAGLGLVPDRPLDLRGAELALAALGHSERFLAVWLNPGGAGSAATFRPELEPAPKRAFGVGVAFDQFMSGRLWVGGVDRSMFNANAEGALIVRLGSYAQDANAFLRLRAKVRRRFLPVTLGARLSHESIRLFEGRGELPSAETQEVGSFLGLRDDPEPSAWRYEAGFDARLWREPRRDTRGSGGLRASYFRARDEYEMASIIEGIALTDFQRVRVDLSRSITLAGLQARLRMRLGWGHRVPVQSTFTLGGSDGFAGLRIGEIRGSQEAFASVQVKRRVAPQIHAVLEGMTGSIGDGSGFLVRRDSSYFGRIYGGVRAGVEANTPIGPIRVEEGFNNAGTRSLLFRVGYWF